MGKVRCLVLTFLLECRPFLVEVGLGLGSLGTALATPRGPRPVQLLRVCADPALHPPLLTTPSSSLLPSKMLTLVDNITLLWRKLTGLWPKESEKKKNGET